MFWAGLPLPRGRMAWRTFPVRATGTSTGHFGRFRGRVLHARFFSLNLDVSHQVFALVGEGFHGFPTPTQLRVPFPPVFSSRSLTRATVCGRLRSVGDSGLHVLPLLVFEVRDVSSSMSAIHRRRLRLLARCRWPVGALAGSRQLPRHALVSGLSAASRSCPRSRVS